MVFEKCCYGSSAVQSGNADSYLAYMRGYTPVETAEREVAL